MNFVRGLISVGFVYVIGYGIFRLGVIKGTNETRSALSFKVENCNKIIAGSAYER